MNLVRIPLDLAVLPGRRAIGIVKATWMTRISSEAIIVYPPPQRKGTGSSPLYANFRIGTSLVAAIIKTNVVYVHFFLYYPLVCITHIVVAIAMLEKVFRR